MNDVRHHASNEHRPHSRHAVIRSIEARVNEQRSFGEKIADYLVAWFGTIGFLIANLVVFVAWIITNSGAIDSIEPFDPFPFTFLTMLVSLEAIVLAIVVLISQNREAQISKLREEIDIQMDTIAEQETTKTLHLLAAVMKHLKVPLDNDNDLKEMMEPFDRGKIERELERQLDIPLTKD